MKVEGGAVRTLTTGIAMTGIWMDMESVWRKNLVDLLTKLSVCTLRWILTWYIRLKLITKLLFLGVDHRTTP